MPWGPNYESMGPSWGESLLQLANSITAVRKMKRDEKQQAIENERQAKMDKAVLEESGTRTETAKFELGKKKGFADYAAKKIGMGTSERGPTELLKPSKYAHPEDEALTDPALRGTLGAESSQATEQKSTSAPVGSPDDIGAYRKELEGTAQYVEPEQYLSGKKSLADFQQKAQKSNKEIFEELSPEAKKQVYAIAERRAKGIDPPDQYIKDFPAFGKNGSIRAVVDNLTYEINPDFNAYEGTIAYGAKRSEKAKEATLTPGIISKEAGQRYATTTAGEQAQRDIQKTNPMLTGEGSIKIAQSAMAIKNLMRLKEELEKGNIDYFDVIKKTGQFKNPKVNNAFQQVSEIVGRQQSGAAIANHEWANFGKEILNRNFLLTEQGRKTALENIDDYLDRFHSVGILQTSDEDWYNKQSERVKAARERASASPSKAKDYLSEIRARRTAAGGQK